MLDLALLRVQDHAVLGNATPGLENKSKLIECNITTNVPLQLLQGVEGGNVVLLEVCCELVVRDLLLLYAWIISKVAMLLVNIS